MNKPKLEKIAATARLYDCYASLLTEKQALALRLFYDEDFSLSEIAQETGGSRQAAHELIQRGEELLAHYERALGVVAREERRRQALLQLRQEAAQILDARQWAQLAPLLVQLEEE